MDTEAGDDEENPDKEKVRELKETYEEAKRSLEDAKKEVAANKRRKVE